MLAGLLLFTRAQFRTAASPFEVAILAGASRDSNAAGDSGRGVSKLSAIYENPGGGAIFVPWTRLQEIGPSLHCSPSISRCGLVTRVRPVVLTHKVVLGMFGWKIALESPHEKSGLRGEFTVGRHRQRRRLGHRHPARAGKRRPAHRALGATGLRRSCCSSTSRT